MPKSNPQVAAHLEWLGFVRPKGLVVSARALVKAGAILNSRDSEGQQRLNECIAEPQNVTSSHYEPYIPDFRAFASRVLDWNFSSRGYAGTSGSRGGRGDLVRANPMTGALCSNDPVCAQHRPGTGDIEGRPLHGAACHGCALVAETSCEMRNDYLDRALVVPVLGHPDAAFFRPASG